LKRGTRVVLALLTFIVLAGAAWAIRARRGVRIPTLSATGTDVVRAPNGVRIRVEVVNTTGIRGLGMRATRLLRDRGFDVVEVHSGAPRRDSTLVLDRSRHPEWAGTVAKVMGPVARSEARPDTSRYLDVTVLLGTSWRPPSEPLDP
jgi:hypothetical protein